MLQPHLRSWPVLEESVKSTYEDWTMEYFQILNNFYLDYDQRELGVVLNGIEYAEFYQRVQEES